jgi:putative peptidoglycan lipid II flippase
MSRARGIARAGLVVTTAFLLSRVLGWVRMVVVGGTFGVTGELDTFFAAFRIPDLLFQLVAAGALSSALIPILAGLLERGETDRAWRLVSTVVNVMLVALAALAALFGVLAPVIVPAMTPGFTEAQLARTVDLTRIMLASPILLALGAVATSVLNAQGRFAAAAVAPVMYNLAIIGAAVLLAPSLGVAGLAIGVVAGAALHLGIQLRPLLRTGFRFRPAIDLDDRPARQALALLAPRTIGLSASQVTFVVTTILASGLGEGAISAFNFAFTMLQIPIGLIGVPLGVVVFPTLARDLARGAIGEYLGLVSRALRLVLFVMLPITAVGMVLRHDIVTLLFGYGRVDSRAIAMTADALLWFLIGLAAHSAIAVLARAFYAAQDTRTPVAVAILAVAVNSTLAVLLATPLGLAGLATAIAVAAWVEAGTLSWLLQRRQASLNLAGIARLGGLAAVCAVPAAATAAAVDLVVARAVGEDPGRIVLLASTALATAAGAAVYVVLARSLRIPELATIVGVMRELVRRPRSS